MKQTALALLLMVLFAVPVQADLADGLKAVAKQDFKAALKAFKPLADAGDVAAQVNMGNLYLKGGKGVAQDPAEARRWYLKAAERNERIAQTKLGILYYHGLGVDRDPTEAAKWFAKAAEQRERAAQAILGSLYAEGEGVIKNPALAYYWYVLSAEQGSEDAELGRASLEPELTPGEMDEALRLLREYRVRNVDREERAFAAEIEQGTADAGQPKPAEMAKGDQRRIKKTDASKEKDDRSPTTANTAPKKNHHLAPSSPVKAKVDNGKAKVPAEVSKKRDVKKSAVPEKRRKSAQPPAVTGKQSGRASRHP